MARRKVLVCGATGFIGRNVVELLARRSDFELHAVRLSRPEYSCPGVIWHQADLRDAKAVDALVAGFDVIIQAAATTSGAKDIVARPHIHTTDNAVMNSLLLRAAYERQVAQFVFFSCSVMYASSPAPLKETDWDPSRPLEPRYFASGWTKVYIEKMCEFYAGLGRTRHTVIRHANVYGPHDKFDLDRSHVFGATVTKVMTAANQIEVWGDGTEARDFLYVGDLVDFVARAVDGQKTQYELVNVGSGRAVSVDDLVAQLVAASGKKLRVTHDLTKPSIKVSLALDCAKAARDFDWRPRTALADGIALTLDWWRRHPPDAVAVTAR